MKKISIIVPCYNEEKALKYYYEEMNKVLMSLSNYTYEYIFIDDGSEDGTLDFIKKSALQDSAIHYISFSRNFGKEAAIFSGFKHAFGDYVVIMDADLQDPPKLLPDMLTIIENGEYDSVATRRVTRKGEPLIRSFFARTFYKLMSKISDIEIVDGARDYRLMTKRFMKALLSMEEYNRFSKGLFGWVGFKTKWLEFENIERIAGETKWSFLKLLFYSIEGIVAFSTLPLMIAVVFGILFSFLAVLFIFFIVIRTALYGDPVSGWPSMICIILLLGGIQLLCIGVLGEYLAKTYLETKKRPIYICKETNISEGQ
jgi:glycosyltransferase involved in cell wall biosynthesis